VVSTRVGYAGGATARPTYHNIGDHSETVEVVYDPSVISYEDLLDVFWQAHSPGISYSRQYMSAVFYYSQAQKKLAEESRDRLQAEKGRRVHTEILPANFYPAEDYHQKYYLQSATELFGEFRKIYPDTADLVRSTAVARVNGYAAGYGTPETLNKELDDLGLSAQAQEKLLDLAGHGLRSACPLP
jgi:peptide-methionine (S)-S-oxide reductase